MFVTNHVLAGSLLGGPLRRRPVAAFAAGFASHLLLDACPHWGTGASQLSEEFLRIARRDGLSGLSALTGAVATAPAGTRLATLAATVGAALPDMDKPCLVFFGFTPWPAWFDRFHRWIQRESPDRLGHEMGLAVALAVVVGAARWRAARGGRRSALPAR